MFVTRFVLFEVPTFFWHPHTVNPLVITVLLLMLLPCASHFPRWSCQLATRRLKRQPSLRMQRQGRSQTLGVMRLKLNLTELYQRTGLSLSSGNI